MAATSVCFRLTSITPGAADRLYAKLKEKTRWRRARPHRGAFASRCANAPGMLPDVTNRRSFRGKIHSTKWNLSYEPKPTRPVTHDELVRFVKAADEAGESSLGTAAMIAYYWLQREEDIIARLSWSHYRPVDAPDVARIFHHKTGELVDIPLYDEDGTVLWPELMERLDVAPRYGTLIVTRDRARPSPKTTPPMERGLFPPSRGGNP